MRAKQTIIVRKSAAGSRAAAERIARRHADRIYTSRETDGGWRFRQRPPSCFTAGSLRTFCVPDGKACIVYGTLRKGAEKKKSCR